MRLLTFFLLLSLSISFAQTTPTGDALTLAEVLDLAPANDPDVLGAQADLEAAQRDLTRLQADPLALKVPTLQAERVLENAQAALESARLTSRTEATSAYFDALSADSSLNIAEQTVAVQEVSLQATQIRFEAGAATDLELLQAENALAEAQRSQQNADQARDLAYSELTSLTGEEVTRLAQVSLTPPAIPALEASLDRAETENSGVQAAVTTVEVAEAQLAAVDNAFSAQTDIDAARDDLTSARSDLDTTRRSLDLSVRGAHNTLSSAARGFEGAQASFEASQGELAAQEARLEAGSLAPISYQEAVLGHLQTEAEMYSALYTFRLAALQLEGTISGGGATEGVSVETPSTNGSAPTEATSSDTQDMSLQDGTGTELIETEPDTTEPTAPDTVAPGGTEDPEAP